MAEMGDFAWLSRPDRRSEVCRRLGLAPSVFYRWCAVAENGSAKALEQDAQGRGLGEPLLVDAIERTRRSIAQIVGAGLYAHALNEQAAAFYVRYSFRRLLDDPKSLFLSLDRH
jgi:GNAT superfamily N-acetyltransferase